jgi:hypothetical protein
VLALVALAACGKKPASHDAAPQQLPVQSTDSKQITSPPADSALSGCSSIPDRLAVQRGIQDAMKAIYGVDEAPAKFVVLKITPTDCEHMTVLYRSQTAGAASQSAPIAIGDGGKWAITLFNKPYPIP